MSRRIPASSQRGLRSRTPSSSLRTCDVVFGVNVAILLPRARFGALCARASERRRPLLSGASGPEAGSAGREASPAGDATVLEREPRPLAFPALRCACRAGGDSMRNTAPESPVRAAGRGGAGGRLRRPGGVAGRGREVGGTGLEPVTPSLSNCFGPLRLSRAAYARCPQTGGSCGFATPRQRQRPKATKDPLQPFR